MSVELPEAIVQFLRSQPSGCWALRSEGNTALLVKASADIVHPLWRTPPVLTFQPAQQEGAWGLGLRLEIGELAFDVFWDLAQENQRRDARSLTTQDYIDVLFFDEDINHIYTRRLPHGSQERERVKAIIQEALSGG